MRFLRASLRELVSNTRTRVKRGRNPNKPTSMLTQQQLMSVKSEVVKTPYSTERAKKMSLQVHRSDNNFSGRGRGGASSNGRGRGGRGRGGWGRGGVTNNSNRGGFILKTGYIPGNNNNYKPNPISDTKKSDVHSRLGFKTGYQSNQKSMSTPKPTARMNPYADNKRTLPNRISQDATKDNYRPKEPKKPDYKSMKKKNQASKSNYNVKKSASTKAPITKRNVNVTINPLYEPEPEISNSRPSQAPITKKRDHSICSLSTSSSSEDIDFEALNFQHLNITEKIENKYSKLIEKVLKTCPVFYKYVLEMARLEAGKNDFENYKIRLDSSNRNSSENDSGIILSPDKIKLVDKTSMASTVSEYFKFKNKVAKSCQSAIREKDKSRLEKLAKILDSAVTASIAQKRQQKSAGSSLVEPNPDVYLQFADNFTHESSETFDMNKFLSKVAGIFIDKNGEKGFFVSQYDLYIFKCIEKLDESDEELFGQGILRFFIVKIYFPKFLNIIIIVNLTKRFL